MVAQEGGGGGGRSGSGGRRMVKETVARFPVDLHSDEKMRHQDGQLTCGTREKSRMQRGVTLTAAGWLQTRVEGALRVVVVRRIAALHAFSDMEELTLVSEDAQRPDAA